MSDIYKFVRYLTHIWQIVKVFLYDSCWRHISLLKAVLFCVAILQKKNSYTSKNLFPFDFGEEKTVGTSFFRGVFLLSLSLWKVMLWARNAWGTHLGLLCSRQLPTPTRASVVAYYDYSTSAIAIRNFKKRFITHRYWMIQSILKGLTARSRLERWRECRELGLCLYWVQGWSA